MADDHRSAHRLTDQVGEVSTNIQQTLEKRLADLKQLLKTNPALSSTEAAHVEACDVRVAIIASEQVVNSFPGGLPKLSAIRYIRGASRSQRPHRQYMGSSAQTRTSIRSATLFGYRRDARGRPTCHQPYCLSPPSEVDHVTRIPPLPCKILGDKYIKNHK
jgi:hypothetical protein